jgi:hypothetical protein
VVGGVRSCGMGAEGERLRLGGEVEEGVGSALEVKSFNVEANARGREMALKCRLIPDKYYTPDTVDNLRRVTQHVRIEVEREE